MTGQFDLTEARNSELVALRLVVDGLIRDLRQQRHPRVAAAMESLLPAVDAEIERRVAEASERAVYVTCPVLGSLTIADIGRLGRAAAKCATGAARCSRNGAASFWFEVAALCQGELRTRNEAAAEAYKGLLN